MADEIQKRSARSALSPTPTPLGSSPGPNTARSLCSASDLASPLSQPANLPNKSHINALQVAAPPWTLNFASPHVTSNHHSLDGHQVGGEYGDVVDWIMIEV